MKVPKILLVLVCILGNIGIFAYLLFQKPYFSQPNLREVASYPKEYIYEPTYAADPIEQAAVAYPFIKTPPWDIKYPFLTFREEFHLNTKRFDELFLAEKRIAEVLLWGNQLPIEHSIKNGGAESLVAWWKSQTIKNYNSWEASLARYVIRVDNGLRELSALPTQQSQNSERIYLATHIKAHYYDLERTINESQKSPEEKNYLISLNKSIYGYLFNKSLENVSTANEHAITLTPVKPSRDKEFGTYALNLFNIPQVWENPDDVTLHYGNELHKINATSDGFASSNLIIAPSSYTDLARKIVISYPEVNLANQLTWLWNPKKKEYDAQIKPNGFDKYLFELKTDIENPYVIKITETKRANIRGKFVYDDTDLLNEEITPQSAPFAKKWILTSSSKNKDFVLTIRIASLKKKVIVNPYTISSFSLVPIPEPLVQLRRTTEMGKGDSALVKRLGLYSYTLTKKDLSLTEKEYLQSHYLQWKMDEKGDIVNFTYRPYLITLKLLVIFNSLFLILIIFNTLKRKRKILFNLANIIRGIGSKLKYGLLLVFILGLIFDLFILRDYSSVVFLGLTLVWILIIVGLKLQALSGFNLTLFFLILVPFFAYFDNEGIAEKLAIWAINFAIISSFQLLIFIDHSSSNTPRSFTVMRMVTRPLSFIINKIIELADSSLKLLKRLILSIFNLQPKTFSDYLLNIIKLIFLVAITIVLTYIIGSISIKINQEIAIKKEREVQLSRHPKISKFEPQIVYFSNKVLIKGNNFGWKQYDKVRLLKDGEVVSTDLWADNKIIFTVPLHWNVGQANFWVEKKVSWKGKAYMAKSNVVTLKIIPRSNTFTPADDEYFNQLKYLDKETLRINGYSD